MLKKTIVSALCVSICCSGWAQVKKPVSAAHATGASQAAPAALKTTQDSLSYAIGLSVANFYKQQNISNINTALVMRAINDVNKGGKLVLDEQQANACIVGYMQKAKAEKATAAKKIGQDFLAANKNKPG